VIGYPKWFYKALMVMLITLLVSGVLLIPTMLDLRLEWDMPWRLSADMRIYTAALHTLFAFMVFMAIGALWSIHMRQGWRKKSNKKSGLALMCLMSLLLLSAVAIFYLSDELALTLASLIHAVLGVGIGLLFIQHAFLYKIKFRATKCKTHSSIAY
jgi:heme A synthase